MSAPETLRPLAHRLGPQHLRSNRRDRQASIGKGQAPSFVPPCPGQDLRDTTRVDVEPGTDLLMIQPLSIEGTDLACQCMTHPLGPWPWSLDGPFAAQPRNPGLQHCDRDRDLLSALGVGRPHQTLDLLAHTRHIRHRRLPGAKLVSGVWDGHCPKDLDVGILDNTRSSPHSKVVNLEGVVELEFEAPHACRISVLPSQGSCPALRDAPSEAASPPCGALMIFVKFTPSRSAA
jgi:hypothetical protein